MLNWSGRQRRSRTALALPLTHLLSIHLHDRLLFYCYLTGTVPAIYVQI